MLQPLVCSWTPDEWGVQNRMEPGAGGRVGDVQQRNLWLNVDMRIRLEYPFFNFQDDPHVSSSAVCLRQNGCAASAADKAKS